VTLPAGVAVDCDQHPAGGALQGSHVTGLDHQTVSRLSAIRPNEGGAMVQAPGNDPDANLEKDALHYQLIL
jgi:hypothetical protein